MSSLTDRSETMPMGAARQRVRFASACPTLRLGMTLPGTWRTSPPFPFDSSPQFHYLARNGIYALARLWKLAGQEILFPAYFHGVEVQTLLAAGVKLRFYPVHAGMRVDFDEILSHITPNTRAVYVIHYLGFPAPIERLAELCRDRGLLLIEDCALALLSRLDDKPLGSFGDAAIFCLYKTLPVPNGGALVVRDFVDGSLPELDAPSLLSTAAYTATAIWRNLNIETDAGAYKLIRRVRNLGKSVSGRNGLVQVGNNHFNPAHVNLAMSRVCQWILARQNFDDIVSLRRRNYLHLLRRLREISPPVFAELPPGVCPLFYPLQTANKRIVFERLLQRRVEAVNFWSQSSVSTPEGAFPEVDELRRTILELPCHQDLTPEAVDWIADEVCALWKELKK
jgi:perosamine synthetase